MPLALSRITRSRPDPYELLSHHPQGQNVRAIASGLRPSKRKKLLSILGESDSDSASQTTISGGAFCLFVVVD